MDEVELGKPRIQKLSRRKFLESFGKASLTGLVAGLDPLFRSTEVNPLNNLNFNPNASLTNLSMVPQDVYSHSNRENILFPVNIKTTYNENVNDHVNNDPQSSELCRYGPGLNEAIARQQKVLFIIDFPGETNLINIVDWGKYIQGIFSRYKPSFVVIGNELNIPAHKRWKEQPDQAAKYFIEAVEKIKEVSPKSQILMQGDACFEHGEFLINMLQSIKNQKPEILKQIADLSFHSYGNASLLFERVNLYQKIAGQFSLPKKLFLTELGKEEGKILDPKVHKNTLIQEISVALALINKGDLDSVFWHAAYQPPHEDPFEHSLTYYKKGEQKVRSKDLFYTFWNISKLLYKDVSIVVSKGITTVKGVTSDGSEVFVIWNNSSYSQTQNDIKIKHPNPNLDEIVLLKTISPYCEGEPVIYLNGKKYSGLVNI